jgi:hypothetical protein
LPVQVKITFSGYFYEILYFSFQILESLDDDRRGREGGFIAKRIYVEKTDTREEIDFGDKTFAMEGSNT